MGQVRLMTGEPRVLVSISQALPAQILIHLLIHGDNEKQGQDLLSIHFSVE